MKSRLFISLMVIALAAALIGGATMAWFTDADDAGEAVFTAGTLTIDVSDGLDQLFEISPKIENMNPGDVYGPIEIQITNDGSKNLAWFGNWTFTPEVADNDKLLDAIYIKSMKMEFLDEDDALWNNDPWYSGYKFIEDGVGALSPVHDNAGEKDAFDLLIDSDGLGVITLRNWNDNPTMAPGTVYEHMGALKPGNKYVLTVEFGFHSGAGNEYQGDATGVSPITVGFTVNATQINADAITAEIPGVLGSDHIVWLNNQILVQP